MQAAGTPSSVAVPHAAVQASPHPQGDPFASPSRCRVIVPGGLAGIPLELLATRTRRTAVCDFLTRSFGAAVSASGGSWVGALGVM